MDELAYKFGRENIRIPTEKERRGKRKRSKDKTI